MKIILLLIVFIASACASNKSNNAQGQPDAQTDIAPQCSGDHDLTLAGDVTAIAEFPFRNAFDPTDETEYTPASQLPAPVMHDVWGNRGSGRHGTMGVFPPGFSAPLHTHSADYHGVVVQGELTNPFGTDLQAILDGEAHGTKTLGPGSYWYVPANSQHTTTCVGPEACIFYFYSENAFDFAPIVDENGALQNGVQLANDDKAVLLAASEVSFAGEPGSFVEFGAAAGDMTAGAHGTFGKFTAGAIAPVHTHSSDYYGVVIGGQMSNPFGENTDDYSDEIGPGGFWNVPANSVHTTTCTDASECLFFFHSANAFDFSPTCM